MSGSDHPLVGRTLGRFEIQAWLGAGGMGDVFRALDTSLGRQVAVKMLKPDLSSDATSTARFRREARALAALRHPNIVAVYSVDEHAGQPMLAMELIEGTPLSSQVREGGLDTTELIALALPLTDAVAAAHERGITHRDLKPANVMLGHDGRLTVLDFGLARLVEEPAVDGRTRTGTAPLTETGRMMGTVAYMSPEQAEGRPADPRSDVFALGIMLYELLSGRRPFDGATWLATLASVSRDDPKPLTRLRPDLPSTLTRIVMRALDKDPSARYPTARELHEALADLELQPRSPAHGPGRQPVRSVAVLPLANLSGDAAQEVFSDGLTEALITDLAKVRGLRVISRGSALRFKHTDKALADIASELDVDAIVQGSVLRAERRVRVSAQLIDARTDTHVWADSYDRDLSDVLSLLSELAGAVAGDIKGRLDPEDEARLKPRRPLAPQAHDEFLQGRHHAELVTADAGRKAIEHFESAIALEPNFAEAHGFLALEYLNLGTWLKAMPLDESIRLGTQAARRALALDPESGPAHTALGYVALLYDWDLEAADRELLTATTVAPSHAQGQVVYSWLLSITGRHDEAHLRLETARQVDPLSPWVSITATAPSYFEGDYQTATTRARTVVSMYPDIPLTHWWLGICLAATNHLDEAEAELRIAAGKAQEYLGWLGYVVGRQGRREEADAILRDIRQRHAEGSASADDVAKTYVGLGDYDRALEWLSRALDERAVSAMFLGVDDYTRPLRDDPRFQTLLGRLGLDSK